MPLRIAREAAGRFMSDDAPEIAAALAYRFFLALVPFLIFLAALSAFVTSWLGIPDAAQRVQSLISSTVPPNVGGILTDQLRAILGERRPGTLSASLAFTLFAATGATMSLMKAMNTAYDVPESRGWLRKYAIGIGLTLLAAATVILAFALLGAAWLFTSGAARALGLGDQYRALVGLAPLPLVVLALGVGAGILYRLGPNLRVPWRGVIPGAVLFPLAWLAGTYGLSVYVASFAGYDRTYGALAGIVVFLVWLYLTGALLLAGAELNAAVTKVTRPEHVRRERRRTGGELEQRSGPVRGEGHAA